MLDIPFNEKCFLKNRYSKWLCYALHKMDSQNTTGSTTAKHTRTKWCFGYIYDVLVLFISLSWEEQNVAQWRNGFIRSISHGDPLSYFLFQPMLHDWCNKSCGMCYPVCGMVCIKEPMLLIKMSSSCSGGFPLWLSEYSFVICLMPYNNK